MDGPLSPVGEPPPALAEPQFRSCGFYGKRSDDEAGGVCIQDGHATFLNCVFSGNHANGYGAAIYINVDFSGADTHSEATVINCSFANNKTGPNAQSEQRNCIYSGDLLEVRNSIMWWTISSPSLSGDQIITVSGATTVQSDNNIQGPSTSNPAYADSIGFDAVPGTLDDNLRLDCSSPSRNAGSNSHLVDDDYDVDDDGVTTAEDTPSGIGNCEFSNRRWTRARTRW